MGSSQNRPVMVQVKPATFSGHINQTTHLAGGAGWSHGAEHLDTRPNGLQSRFGAFPFAQASSARGADKYRILNMNHRRASRPNT